MHDVEIGIGTGRFSKHLNISTEVEPSRLKVDIARRHGMKVLDVVAENPLIGDEQFDLY